VKHPVYVGETKKILDERLKQHQRAVEKEDEKNAIFRHIKETGHEMDWEGANIVEKEKNWYRRRVLESMHIKKVNKEGGHMNHNVGMKISTVWESEIKEICNRFKKRNHVKKKIYKNKGGKMKTKSRWKKHRDENTSGQEDNHKKRGKGTNPWDAKKMRSGRILY
jgi:hypothetical protein